ncbi:MAG: c-type cytochrome [Dehalococcoidia bacterium]|nr:c-type cytochrome [Dehalococcoidia bacterium]
MKILKFTITLLPALLVLFLLATTVIAQEVPPPYAGATNPFKWDDASAQNAGKQIYQQSCLGCHGIDGKNVPSANFGSPEYRQNLEKSPDHAFWIFSEGKMSNGMPPFKGSLSEEKRWQVITFLWSLGKEVPPPATATPSPGQPPVEPPRGILKLSVPASVEAGKSIDIQATFRDDQDKPLNDISIDFFIREQFFGSGLLEIGSEKTANGIAALNYTHRKAGDTEIIARAGSFESVAPINITEASQAFYHTEAGIHLPSPGPEVFIGPDSSRGLDEMGQAPNSAFRLPGGITSGLLVFAGAIALVWITYFRVVLTLFRIPGPVKRGETNTRVVPILGMLIVAAMGLLLVLLILTGPYSHFHLD